MDFDGVFYPTPQQELVEARLYNSLVLDLLELYGRACATCRYKVYVQENVYNDYASCYFGDGSPIRYDGFCNKYDFMGLQEEN